MCHAALPPIVYMVLVIAVWGRMHLAIGHRPGNVATKVNNQRSTEQLGIWQQTSDLIHYEQHR